MTEPVPPLALGAVLLAGGASRRFGAENKLLAEVDGVPIVTRVARAVLDGGADTLIVVTGAEHDAYAVALAGMPALCVANPRWADGMGGSIAVGVQALPVHCAGAFIVPADMASLSADVLRRLAEAFARDGGERVVVPVTPAGAQRNPVLWPRRLFPSLAALSGPQGGKSLLDTPGTARLDVAFADSSVFADIDTPGDYERLIAGA